MTNKRWLFCILLATCLLTACKQSAVYYHYEDTPEGGWEKNDHLIFDTDTFTEDASYQEEVAIRINNMYPFMQLTLIVNQTIYPSGYSMTDTLDCKLIDERGNVMGEGISQYNYLFPLKTLKLHHGDSLHLSVRHGMKREMLPGVTGVGIKVEKK
jgi:gliding motility-associated lipoprotein GldH